MLVFYTVVMLDIAHFLRQNGEFVACETNFLVVQIIIR
jgi:hypothetical protein